MWCSDWSNDASGRPSLIGKETAPRHRIFDAPEGAGRVRFYLVQQEGSGEPPLEAVRKDLECFREIHR